MRLKYYSVVVRNVRRHVCDRYVLATADCEAVQDLGGPHDVFTEIPQAVFDYSSPKMFSEKAEMLLAAETISKPIVDV